MIVCILHDDSDFEADSLEESKSSLEQIEKQAKENESHSNCKDVKETRTCGSSLSTLRIHNPKCNFNYL